MNSAYAERCRCVRDLKLLIPSEVWEKADSQNPTNDNWRTTCIAVEILSECYKIQGGNDVRNIS